MVTYIKNRVNCWKPKPKGMAISNQDCIEIYNKAQRLSKAIKFYLTNVTNCDTIRISRIADEVSRVGRSAIFRSALHLNIR